MVCKTKLFGFRFQKSADALDLQLLPNVRKLSHGLTMRKHLIVTMSRPVPYLDWGIDPIFILSFP